MFFRLLDLPKTKNFVLNVRSFRGFRDHSRKLSWRVKNLLHKSTDESDVVINGFVRSIRKQRRMAFAAINDGSCLTALQAVLKPEQAAKLSTGAAVTLKGQWVLSLGGGQARELRVDEVDVKGYNNSEAYPIQKKYQTEEFLRTKPHLRVRTPFNALLLRLRSQMIFEITAFFQSRGFYQTHTPMVTSSDCEGAGEAFTLSPAASRPIELTSERGKDSTPVNEQFFRVPKYLTVSSQLHLEALSQSVCNVWTLSPAFRAEKSDTGRHLSEFYMLEAEMAFVETIEPVMDLVEELIRFLARRLKDSDNGQDLLAAWAVSGQENSPDSVSASAHTSQGELLHRWNALLGKPWPRISYEQALELLQTATASGVATFTTPLDALGGLQTEHERFIAETVGCGSPVFVMDYPESIKPFYMAPSVSSSSTSPSVACFDLLFPDLCEIAGGSVREHRLDRLQEAMQRRSLLPAHYVQTAPSATKSPGQDQPRANTAQGRSLDWYLDLRRYGSLPHAGFGLGFDRLLAYLAGVSNIRDMVTFPRYYKKCDC